MSNQVTEVAKEALELGILAPVLGAIGCGRGGAGLARPTLPRSFESSPEVLEEVLELGMLVGDAEPLHPPDALIIATMSLSTLSRVIVLVQMIHYLHKRKEVGVVIIEEESSAMWFSRAKMEQEVQAYHAYTN